MLGVRVVQVCVRGGGLGKGTCERRGSAASCTSQAEPAHRAQRWRQAPPRFAGRCCPPAPHSRRVPLVAPLPAHLCAGSSQPAPLSTQSGSPSSSGVRRGG
jgi:hypothetical protein